MRAGRSGAVVPQAAGAAGEVKATGLRLRIKIGVPKLGVDENKPLAAKGGVAKAAQANRRARRTRSLSEMLSEPPASMQAQQQDFAAPERPQVWLHMQWDSC